MQNSTEISLRRHSPAIRSGLRHLLAASVIVLALSSAEPRADEVQNASTPAAQAQFVVQDTTSRVLAAMFREQQAIEDEPSRAFDVVERIVMPYVDLERISGLLLGRYWLEATEEQQKRFMKEFGFQLVRTYTIGVSDYLALSGRVGIDINYLPVDLSEDNRRARVRSHVEVPGVQTQIDYFLHRSDDAWQVYDLRVDGVSVVLTYKSAFVAAARQGGIDYLIERIAAQNRKSNPT